MSRLPNTHTLDAHQLRAVNRVIDSVAFQASRWRAVLPKALTDQVDSLVRVWQPIRNELERQHIAHVHGTDVQRDVRRHLDEQGVTR